MDRSLIKQISCLDHLIHSRALGKNGMKKVLNYTQLQILFYLLHHQGEDVCQKDLENEAHLKKASITAILDALADKDLIYREVCESDRRKNFIRLSDKTMEYARKMVEKEKEYNAKIVAGIPEEELAIFFKVTDRVISNIMGEDNEADI